MQSPSEANSCSVIHDIPHRTQRSVTKPLSLARLMHFTFSTYFTTRSFLISSHLHLDLLNGFSPSGPPIQYYITKKKKNKTSAKSESSGVPACGHTLAGTIIWHDGRDKTRSSKNQMTEVISGRVFSTFIRMSLKTINHTTATQKRQRDLIEVTECFAHTLRT
jgi:hypothetical protein